MLFQSGLLLSLALAIMHSDFVCAAAFPFPGECGELSNDASPIYLDNNHISASRASIVAFARSSGLPAMLLDTSSGATPVLLINQKTASLWAPLLRKTFGIAESLHPSNEANHGHARLPGAWESRTQGVMIDLFSPPQAGRNAINGTGYRWRGLFDYLSNGGLFTNREGSSKQYLDIAYALNQKDMERVWLTHAIRRAAWMRVVYRFEQNPFNEFNVRQRRMLFDEDGREHCNNSRLAQCGVSQATQMRQRLRDLGIADANALFNKLEFQRFIDQAKALLLAADWMNAATYNDQLVNQDRFIDLIQPYMAGRTREDMIDALIYLVNINVVEEAADLQRRLGIVEGRQEQLENPHAVAILIWANEPGTGRDFYTATARFRGAASGRGFSGDDLHTQSLYPSGAPVDWQSRWDMQPVP